MARFTVNRRRFLTGAALGTGSLLLSGCDAIGQNPTARNLLQRAETLTEAVQRALLDRDALAPEFSESEIIQPMRPNGTTAPRDLEYRALAASGFANWRLQVNGLVNRPLSLSLEELRNMPSRTQITRTTAWTAGTALRNGRECRWPLSSTRRASSRRRATLFSIQPTRWTTRSQVR